MEELWATHIREVSLVSTGIWARLPWVYFYFDIACILRARAFAENWLLVLLLETSFSITREISGTSQEIFQRSRNRKCLETSLPGNVRDPPRKCVGPSKKSWRWKEIVEELSVTIPENVWDHRRKVAEEKKLSRNCLGPSKHGRWGRCEAFPVISTPAVSLIALPGYTLTICTAHFSLGTHWCH